MRHAFPDADHRARVSARVFGLGPPAAGEEGEESIEAYMERLLRRVRGDEDR